MVDGSRVELDAALACKGRRSHQTPPETIAARFSEIRGGPFSLGGCVVLVRFAGGKPREMVPMPNALYPGRELGDDRPPSLFHKTPRTC